MNADPTGIVLRRDSGLPAYRQLVDQFRFLIQTGRFREGEYLPPMRAVAADVGLNLNTVNRAYQQLQRDGLIRSTPGKGAVVTPRGQVGSVPSLDDRGFADAAAPGSVRSILTAAVERALAAGLDASAISRQVDEILAECEDRSPTRPRVAVLVSHDFRIGPVVAALQRVAGTDTIVRAVTSAGDATSVDLWVRPSYGVEATTGEVPPGSVAIDLQVLADRPSTERLLDLPKESRLVVVAADRAAAAWLVNLSSTLAEPAEVRVIVDAAAQPLSIDNDEIVVIEALHPATTQCQAPFVPVAPAFGEAAAVAIRTALESER